MPFRSNANIVRLNWPLLDSINFPEKTRNIFCLHYGYKFIRRSLFFRTNGFHSKSGLLSKHTFLSVPGEWYVAHPGAICNGKRPFRVTEKVIASWTNAASVQWAETRVKKKWTYHWNISWIENKTVIIGAILSVDNFLCKLPYLESSSGLPFWRTWRCYWGDIGYCWPVLSKWGSLDLWESRVVTDSMRFRKQ